MVQEASAYRPLLSGLATNPALPVELLDRLIAVADPASCLDLADRDDLTASHMRQLATRGGVDTTIRLVRRGLLSVADVDAPDPRVMAALIDETEVPEPWARALSALPDPAMRAELAAATYVPAQILAGLAEDTEVEVVEAVAASTRLTLGLAQRLAKHPHLTVRRAIAFNERAPPWVLVALATSGGMPAARWCAGCDGSGASADWVRCTGDHESALTDLAYAIAANPATPSGTIADLAEHPMAYVRCEVAHRTDLPQHSYDTLATDPDPRVRGAVAENPAIDERLIRALAGDDSNEVRRQLAHNPAIPLDVLAEIAPVTRFSESLLPRIVAATADEVAALARSPVPALRRLLAERPDLPAPTLNRLAEDTDAKVLKSLASNAGLTDDQLRAMVARHGARVVAAVARNPACSPRLLHDLATRTHPERKALKAIAAHPNAGAATLVHCLHDPQARRIAARHPALPAATIAGLFQDTDGQVVEAAAANPSLPRASMVYLVDRSASPNPVTPHPQYPG